MTENDLQALKRSNAWRACVWLIVLLLLTIWSCIRVQYDYQAVGQAESVSHYVACLWGTWAVVSASAVLWWLITTWCTGQVRSLVEESSFAGSLIFVAAVFAASGALFFLSGGILDTNGHPQPDGYMFALPCAFGCLMYCVPPVNVEKVIWPFGTRFLPGLGFGAGLAAVAVRYLLGGG